VHLDYVQRVYRRNLQVIGENGVILWDYPSHTVTIEGSDQDAIESVDDGGPNAMYQSEVRDFLRCVLEGGRPVADGRDGLRAIRIVEAAKRSARDGGWVKP